MALLAPVCLAPQLPKEWNTLPYDCTETSPALQPGQLIFDYFLCLSLYRFPIADIHLLLMELCLHLHMLHLHNGVGVGQSLKGS